MSHPIAPASVSRKWPRRLIEAFGVNDKNRPFTIGLKTGDVIRFGGVDAADPGDGNFVSLADPQFTKGGHTLQAHKGSGALPDDKGYGIFLMPDGKHIAPVTQHEANLAVERKGFLLPPPLYVMYKMPDGTVVKAAPGSPETRARQQGGVKVVDTGAVAHRLDVALDAIAFVG